MLKPYLLLTLFISLSGSAWGSTLRSDGSTVKLKSILANLGHDLLRGLVIDGDGKEAKIFLYEKDAVEVKRGLWVLRKGDFEREI